MDTMFATKHNYTKGRKCCQYFLSDKGYISPFPIKSQDELETSQNCFFKEVGAPVNLILDRFITQKKSYLKRFCDQDGTTLKIPEINASW